MELEQGLVSYLKAQASIFSQVGNRITPVFLPQGFSLPALVFRRVGGSGARSLSGGLSGLATGLFDVTAWHADYFAAKALAKLVRDALSVENTTFGDIPILEAWQVDGSDEDVIDDESRLSNIPFGVQAQYGVVADEGAIPGLTPSMGTKLLVDGNGAGQFEEFARVLTIAGPNSTAEQIDVTTLADEQYEQKLPSIIDPGELTFRLYFAPSNRLQSPATGLLAFFSTQVVLNWQLRFPTNVLTTMAFPASITSFEIETVAGQPLVARVAVGITGQISWQN